MQVEVVFALPDRQALVSVTVGKGATVADAISRSGLKAEFSNQDLDSMPVGIWGRPTARDCRLKDGDRVEIYRPLQRDPRDARRELAQSGLTMRKAPDG
jgi:putative ubiquitin-RnfH superfamily antitoxin RatB of RatAB toxin-antitoxin module